MDRESSAEVPAIGSRRILSSSLDFLVHSCIVWASFVFPLFHDLRGCAVPLCFELLIDMSTLVAPPKLRLWDSFAPPLTGVLCGLQCPPLPPVGKSSKQRHGLTITVFFSGRAPLPPLTHPGFDSTLFFGYAHPVCFFPPCPDFLHFTLTALKKP